MSRLTVSFEKSEEKFYFGWGIEGNFDILVGNGGTL
jgi:hypothetical protein